MSRSGYVDDMDDVLALGRWRAQVASSIRGKRGQAFLRELIDALDAMPEKKLIAHDLQAGENFCAIGTVGAKRGLDMSNLDPEDSDRIADVFGIARPLVCEIEYMNDEAEWSDDPAKRWLRMRNWAASHLAPTSTKE
jgi:hypothetical protein